MRHRFAPAGIEPDRAEEITGILQKRLSDLIDLSLTLKHIHWNVVGNGFISVHKMMDEQTEGVRALVDQMAERISTLGGVAAGLAGQILEHRSTDKDYSLGRGSVPAHLGALDKMYERIGSQHRDAIDKVGSLDPVSEDLLIGQAATLEMYHWFVRAHIEDIDGHLATDGTDGELEAAASAAATMEPEIVLDESDLKKSAVAG